MRIKIDNTEYSVSMKWEQDDTIRHFVHIDDDVYELDIASHMINDGKTYVTQMAFREILAQHIQKILDTRSGNRRT